MKFSEACPEPDDLILGIDEAGRGPVLGPMILAGALIEQKNMHRLVEIGVKDSKLLSDAQRKRLFHQVKEIVHWKIIIVQPTEIDTCPSGLNVLEMMKVAELTRVLNPKYLVIDSPYSPGSDFNLATFLYQQHINTKNLHCFAENKADDLYPIVSAASIIAKEAREISMQKLRNDLGVDFGSGYPADPKTKEFMLENWANERYTTLIRKSWATYKRLAEEK
jgi:ribonuclease HII